MQAENNTLYSFQARMLETMILQIRNNTMVVSLKTSGRDISSIDAKKSIFEISR